MRPDLEAKPATNRTAAEAPEPEHGLQSYPTGRTPSCRVWEVDPRLQGRTARSLRKLSRRGRNGLAVRTKDGRLHPIAHVNPERSMFRSYEGEVYGLRILSPSLGFDFPEPLRCESGALSVAFDAHLDGAVIFAGAAPVLGFGGRHLHAIPSDVHYLGLESGGQDPDELAALLLAAPPAALLGLSLSGCHELIDLDLFQDLESLTCLRVHHADHLVSLRGLRHLKRLCRLELSQCGKLRSIDEVGLLSSLRTLRMVACQSVCDHAAISVLDTLEDLKVSHAQFDPRHVRKLVRLKRLSLRMVDLDDQEIQGRELSLDRLPQLEELDLLATNWPARLDRLLPLRSLRKLNIGCNQRIRSVEPLLHLPYLEELEMSGCDGIRDFHRLAEGSSLHSVSWSDEEAALAVNIQAAVRRQDLTWIRASSLFWDDYVRAAREPERLVLQCATALASCGGQPWVEASLLGLVKAARARRLAEASSWSAVIDAVLLLGDPAFRPIIEAVLAPACTGEERLPPLVPVIQSLARIPASAREWAVRAVDEAVRTSHADTIPRDVGNSLAWFYRWLPSARGGQPGKAPSP